MQYPLGKYPGLLQQQLVPPGHLIPGGPQLGEKTMSKTLTNQIYFDLCDRFHVALEKIVQSEAILALICGDPRMQHKTLHDIFFSLWALGDLLKVLRAGVDEADDEFQTLKPGDFLKWLEKREANKRSQEGRSMNNVIQLADVRRAKLDKIATQNTAHMVEFCLRMASRFTTRRARADFLRRAVARLDTPRADGRVGEIRQALRELGEAV